MKRFLGIKENSLNLTEAVENNKIVVVNLARSKHLSHDNARLFGSLLVSQFFEAALQRKKDRSGNDPKPYYLYLDEFQNFVSIDIADMLDEVRKFGLFLILAHQRFGQIDPNLIDAILTNCKIKAIFGGLRVDDARRMAEELFIAKLDLKKIKAAIYQTKFYPEYRRDKVYTSGTSYAYSDSRGTSSGRRQRSSANCRTHNAAAERRSFYRRNVAFPAGNNHFRYDFADNDEFKRKIPKLYEQLGRIGSRR